MLIQSYKRALNKWCLLYALYKLFDSVVLRPTDPTVPHLQILQISIDMNEKIVWSRFCCRITGPLTDVMAPNILEKKHGHEIAVKIWWKIHSPK